MGETCEVCGLELASIETRNLLHAGELVRYGEYRGKCVRDASCLQRGYDNAAKVALKLSVEVSEQKARADAAEVERDGWKAIADSHGASVAVLDKALAAARRECEGLRAKMTELAEALASAADDIDSRDTEGFREALREGAVAATEVAE